MVVEVVEALAAEVVEDLERVVLEVKVAEVLDLAEAFRVGTQVQVVVEPAVMAELVVTVDLVDLAEELVAVQEVERVAAVVLASQNLLDLEEA